MSATTIRRMALMPWALCLLMAAACGRTRPPDDARVCFVAAANGAYAPLDEVDNLETCGARLEVLYLERRRPIAGAYGGVLVFVDPSAISAAAPNGPKALLLDPATRRRLDDAIVSLLEIQAAAVKLDVKPSASRSG